MQRRGSGGGCIYTYIYIYIHIHRESVGRGVVVARQAVGQRLVP